MCVLLYDGQLEDTMYYYGNGQSKDSKSETLSINLGLWEFLVECVLKVKLDVEQKV